MQIFISWSRDRSRAVAEGLAKWLGQVIQAVDPWLSVDIEKGTRWGDAVANRLEASRVGIICLTPENVDSPWILFEAGALSKTKDAYVCTFLLDLKPTNVEPPLGQFQHTEFAKADVFQLVQTINSVLERSGGKALAESVLADVFEIFWPQLETRIGQILKTPKGVVATKRTATDMLDEILSTVRNLEHRQARVEKSLGGLWRPVSPSLGHWGYRGADLLHPAPIDERELLNRIARLVREAQHESFEPLDGVADKEDS